MIIPSSTALACCFGERGDRILLTLLERRAQPVIGYEISDMVRELGGECACGHRFRMIGSIEGRVEDILYFPRRDGGHQRVAVHPNLFHGALEIVSATGWQIVHDEQRLTVHLPSPPVEAAPYTCRGCKSRTTLAAGEIILRAANLLDSRRTQSVGAHVIDLG
jgi:phenylacetate-coenzyme A ligase PaaK-like adenylate-forming protein